MFSFLKFISESNAVGSGFEKKTAGMINKWLKKNGLQRVYDVRRFQTVSESKPHQELFSDIQVENIKTGEKFFVECKEADRSNILNMKFEVTEDGKLKALGRNGGVNEDEHALAFADSLANGDEFAKFVDFLNAKNGLTGRRPYEYYFGKADDVDDVLPKLIEKYNRLVKDGRVESDCKPFDAGNIRQSTKSLLVCALCWRLEDPENRTWDIFHTDDIPDFGKMIRGHYSSEKEIPALYIQFNDKLFQTDADENPFNLKDVPVFPDDIKGKFAMKFTPRFGTGSVYVTPRSEITTKLRSDFSFNDEKKWPAIGK